MNAPKTSVNTVRLQNISYGHKQSAALKAAIELDLFTAVSQGATSSQEIARKIGISSLNAERIVVACAGMGLLQKDEGGYKNAADVERFFVKGKSTFVGPWLLFASWWGKPCPMIKTGPWVRRCGDFTRPFFKVWAGRTRKKKSSRILKRPDLKMLTSTRLFPVH